MGFEILNVSRPSRVGEGRVGDRSLDFWAAAILDENPLADVMQNSAPRTGSYRCRESTPLRACRSGPQSTSARLTIGVPCPLIGEGTRELGAETTASTPLDDARGCRIGASASRLPSRHGGTEPISTPRKLPSGMRTLTKRGPAAFPAPSSHIPSASTCLAPASSFCGRSFQTRKTSFRSSSRATEPPGTRVTLYGSDVWSFS